MSPIANIRTMMAFTLCMAAVTAKTQTVTTARECVEGFYSLLQQVVSIDDAPDSITEIIRDGHYVNNFGIYMPADLIRTFFGKNDDHTTLDDYFIKIDKLNDNDSFCEMSFIILNHIHVSNYLDYFIVSKTILYNGKYYDFVDWVHVKHLELDVGNNIFRIEKINETATVHIVGSNGDPLASAIVGSKESESLLAKLPNSRGDYIIGMDSPSRDLKISDPYYSDTVYTTIKRGENINVQLKQKNAFFDQPEKARFRLYIPFAFPLGKLGKGSDNWIESGNAWSNYPFDLTYFFEDNSALKKAARNLGFGLGAKAIIPLKKSTTAIMVQAEYLLMLPNNGNIGAGQTMPAEVFYYQYNPTSGLNNIKILTTEMNMTFPRLNTMDVMLGVNKKFRNIIGSSHLEIEGAMGAAWHWSSDFKGQSITSGEYSFVADYDIFSKRPSLAFEVGVAMTLGRHLSLGLNYVNLGGFDVNGHASCNSTIIPANDANINDVDFHFGHVTVHYLGLVLSYSVQQK